MRKAGMFLAVANVIAKTACAVAAAKTRSVSVLAGSTYYDATA